MYPFDVPIRGKYGYCRKPSQTLENALGALAYAIVRKPPYGAPGSPATRNRSRLSARLRMGMAWAGHAVGNSSSKGVFVKLEVSEALNPKP